MQAPSTQTVAIQAAAPSGPRVYGNYNAGQARFLGWAQITIGLLSIIAWSLAIYFGLTTHFGVNTFLNIVGTGIWCGLFFLLPGSFGVASAKSKTVCPIVTFMVLSIIALVVFDLFYIGWSSTSLIYAIAERGWYNTSRFREGDSRLVAMYSICVLLSVSYLVVSIWSSVICCKAVCCGRSTHTASGQQVMYVHGGNGQQHAYVIPLQPVHQQQYPQQQYPQQQYPQQQYQHLQYPPQQDQQPGTYEKLQN